MSQCVLCGILNRVPEEDCARVEREATERADEKRRQAARKAAATRKARREDAEAQLNMRLIYSTWNRPRKL